MKKTNLNQEVSKESIKFWIDEHKAYLMPLAAIIISIFLFFVFLVPQIISFPSKRTQINEEEKKLNKYVSVRNYLGGVNSKSLNEDLILSTKILPVEKNYTAIVNAISSAAIESGVEIIGYRFVLIDIDSSKTKLSDGVIPILKLQANIKGEINQVQEFMKRLYETAPISEISEVSYVNGLTQINLYFFYKPLPSADISNSEMIRPKNPEEEDVFNQISNWKMPEVGPKDIQIVPATESGEIESSGSPF